MKRPRVTEPRMLTFEETAHYLGHCPKWFKDNQDALFLAGFPLMETLTLRYDKAAIDRWLDIRSNLVQEANQDSDLARRVAEFNNGRSPLEIRRPT